MKPADQISEFVREAMAQGGNQDQIAQALADAGWSAPEVEEALHGWQSAPGLPPVPRPRPYASASEALLYGLLFLSLGVVAWNICDLGMDVVDRLIPDPVERVIMNGYDTTNSGLRWPIATLIVAIQAYGLDPSLEEAARDLGATRWQTLRLVTLPLLGPALFSAGCFSFLLSWGNFALSLYTTGADSALPEWLYSRMVVGYQPLIPAVGTLSVLGAMALALSFYGVVAWRNRRHRATAPTA